MEFTTEELSNEIWKNIPGYKNKYQISNLGRVKSKNKNGKEKYLRFGTNGVGYYNVQLMGDDNKKHNCYVHKLVIENFIGKRPEGYQIDHINAVRNDNRLCNLMFVTPKQNSNNKNTIQNKINKMKSINQYDLNGNLVYTYNNLIELLENTDYNKNTINAALYRHITAYNFIWKFKE